MGNLNIVMHPSTENISEHVKFVDYAITLGNIVRPHQKKKQPNNHLYQHYKKDSGYKH